MESRNKDNEIVVPLFMFVMLFLFLFVWNMPDVIKKISNEAEQENYFENEKEVIMKITEKEKEEEKYYMYGRSKGQVYKLEVDKNYYYKKIVGESMHGFLEVEGDRVMLSTEEDMKEYKYEELKMEGQSI